MSDEKVLTKEIAEQFLADEESVSLWEFTAIEDDAAESLSKHEGDLCLSGTLSDAAAESLSKHKGYLQISFGQVSNSAAAILCKHPTYAGMKVLYIAEPIARLSEQMCSESLSKLEGQGINFDEVLGQEFEEGLFYCQSVEYEDGHVMEVRIETSAGDVDWDDEEEATVCYSLFNKNFDDVCTSTGCYSLLGEYNVYDPETETRYRLDVRKADGQFPATVVVDRLA